MNCFSCDTTFDAAHAALACPSCGTVVPVTLSHRPTALIGGHAGTARNLIATTLKQLGFDLVIYPTGRGLLEELQSFQPQLAILNVMLEGELGVTIVQRVREIPALASTRLVLVGSIHRPDRYRARPQSTYGADGYLEEPFTADQIRDLIGGLAVSSGAAQ